MYIEIILTCVFSSLTIAACLFSYYLYVKNKISNAIATEIDKAEIDDVEGEKKKALVIEQLEKLIPTILKPIISKSMLDALVQTAFDSIEEYAKKQVKKKGAKESENLSDGN